MPKDKRSFFERLTGSVPAEKYYEEEPEETIEEAEETPRAHLAISSTKSRGTKTSHATQSKKEDDWAEEEEEGQLTVDVYQHGEEIVVQAMVAGVRPDELDVSITRDMITLRGRRERTREVEDNNFFYQELYWGTFARSILLPHEVDVDGSDASLKNGLLTVRLPKLDKNRTERLRVKNE